MKAASCEDNPPTKNQFELRRKGAQPLLLCHLLYQCTLRFLILGVALLGFCSLAVQ